MNATEMLINKVRERVSLDCYTEWERKFLQSIIKRWDRNHSLTEKQEDKLKQIIRGRWVQGLSNKEFIK